MRSGVVGQITASKSVYVKWLWLCLADMAHHKKSLLFISCRIFLSPITVLREDICHLIVLVLVKIQIIHRNMDHSHTYSHTWVGGVLQYIFFCVLIWGYPLCFSMYRLLLDSTKLRIQVINFTNKLKRKALPLKLEICCKELFSLGYI